MTDSPMTANEIRVGSAVPTFLVAEIAATRDPNGYVLVFGGD